MLGFLPSPREKKVWVEAEMADHPQLPLRRLLLPFLKMAAPPPRVLFLLCLSQSPSLHLPHRRDMLVGGDGGVPAFVEPFLRQRKVTPRTMSQPSHLQQSLWGQK